MRSEFLILSSTSFSLLPWVNFGPYRRVKRDEETICYPDVGCFRDEGPFDYLDLLPSPPEEINTRFMLYSRGHDVPYLVAYNNLSSIHSSPFNASLPTKIMIHGFGSSCQRVWAKEMIRALIKIIVRTRVKRRCNIQVSKLLLLFSGRCQRNLCRLGEWGQSSKLRSGRRQHATSGSASRSPCQRSQRSQWL